MAIPIRRIHVVLLSAPSILCTRVNLLFGGAVFLALPASSRQRRRTYDARQVHRTPRHTVARSQRSHRPAVGMRARFVKPILHIFRDGFVAGFSASRGLLFRPCCARAALQKQFWPWIDAWEPCLKARARWQRWAEGRGWLSQAHAAPADSSPTGSHRHPRRHPKEPT
jgi:hypothetical protein